MDITVKENKNGQVAHVTGLSKKIETVQDGLDILADIAFGKYITRIIMDKAFFDESFFDLKTKKLGEMLQKYQTYRTKIAIIGDFSVYGSGSLKDFIYESNKGRDVFFLSSADEALKKYEEIT